MLNKILGKKSRNSSKKSRYVKICPRCQSVNIKVTNQGGSAGIIFGAPTIYRCLDCNYSNYSFPEIDINNLKKQKKNDRS
ncbi:MAG: hypothetical protein QXK80_01725 [Candidatus Pacearchaeota archaeon]